MAKITVNDLERKGACDDAIVTFERLFGSEVDLTGMNVEDLGAEVRYFVVHYTYWAEQFLLTSESRKRYEELSRSIRPHYGDDIELCPGCIDRANNFIKVYNEQEA